MKKRSLKDWKDLAWKQFSEYIRVRYSDFDGYVACFTCGMVKQWKEMHAGHFIHGNTKRTYFDEANVHPQCRSCNFYKDGARDLYALKLIEKYGDGIIQDLHAINEDKRIWTVGEVKEIYETYKKKNGN